MIDTRIRVLGLLLVVALAAGVYSSSLGFGFTGDDQWLILDNQRLKAPGYVNYVLFERPLWRPLQRISLMLDYRLWGADPAGFHATNIVLHTLACGLLYLLLLRMGQSALVAGGTASLLAVHPIQVETVANICHRKESMALLFLLLAFLSYLRGLSRAPAGPLSRLLARAGMLNEARAKVAAQVELMVWVGFFYLCAMLSKEVAAVMFPATVLAYHWLLVPREERSLRRLMWLAPPAIAVLAIFTWKGYLARLPGYFGVDKVSSVSLGQASTYGDVLLSSVKAFFVHTRLVVWPWPLTFDPVFAYPQSLTDPGVLAGLGLVIVFVAAVVWSAARAPVACFGLCWYLLHMLPVSNVIPLTIWSVADRYLYVPSVGLFLAAAVTFEVLWRRADALSIEWPRLGAIGAAVVLLCLYSTLTLRQSMVWQSPSTLWEHALEHNPSSARALHGVGLAKELHRQLYDAEQYYERAKEAAPRYMEPHYALARLYAHQGRYERAIEEAHRYADADDEDSRALVIAGFAEMASGRPERAIEVLQVALERNPADLEGTFNLASALHMAGRHSEALETLDKVPKGTSPQQNFLRGKILQNLNRREEALAAYELARYELPRDPHTARAAGIMLLRLGHREKGVAALNWSLKLAPQQHDLRVLLESL